MIRILSCVTAAIATVYVLACTAPASAASLERIKERGSLAICAHPNSLPFASKAGHPPGFQIELGRAIAAQLGVGFTAEWIVAPNQIFRTDCDLVLDTIADPGAQAEAGL